MGIIQRLRDHEPGFSHGSCQDCYSTVMDGAADLIEKMGNLLSEARSGYIAGSGPDEAWDKRCAEVFAALAI